MSDKLIAFHGQQAVKDKYLARVEGHRKADEIIQGQYWYRGKGCAVGCTLHSDNHEDYETELGIPQVLARIQDTTFEGLSIEDSKAFPSQFLSSIQVGADLNGVWPKLAIWILTDEKFGVRQYALPDGAAAIDQVVALYRRVADGEAVDPEEFRAAADAAYAAAYAAARAAYAAYAAYAAARAAYAAADAEFWIALRDQLLALLASAPIAVTA